MALIVRDDSGKTMVISNGTGRYEYDPTKPDCKGEYIPSAYDIIKANRNK